MGFTSDGSGIAGCAAVALSGSGNARTATCATSALSPGTHIILATYGGDGANAASASNALSQSVAAAQSTTGIASSANPSQQGSIVTFTASVSGNAPTGSVAFTDGGSPIAGCGGAPLGGAGNIRTAACATSSLGAGTHAIVATYSGDGTNAGSASPALQQTVNGAAAVPVNVALAASGAVASASSTYGSAFALASINDGDRTGANWGNGTGGWADATSNAFPDWVQINFPGARTIDRVVVYTLRDAAGAAIEPADSEGFGLFGIVDFTVSVWNGAGWVAVASVSGNNLVKRTVTFPAVATDRVRVTVSNALFGYSRIVELEAWTPTGGPTNVAALGNGGIASSSSTYSGAFPLISVNDGDRTGATWGNGGGWADATTGAFPDWVQINFSSARTIDRVVLYTLRDSYYGVAVEPSNSEAFGLFGVVDFNVEAWNGSGWFTVASVSGNTLVKRTVAFAAVTTDRIRVNVGHALASYSRIVELEAWTPATGPTNVAAADYGGFAVASSTYSGAFPLAAVNDGDRTGAAWASGGGWADATNNAFPDWVQIDFGAARTIDRVVVYTLRDSYYGTAVEPGDAETFALFGILDFTVQAWNGASWITVGTVSGNNLVKRTIAFGIVTTDRVRVTVTNALFGYSRIVELEAWTP